MIVMICKHGIDLQLLMSSLILFLVIYSFCCIGLLLPSLNLFLGILIFDVIVNSVIFLTSFSVCSVLVCRDTTDFFILILYAVTLLNVFEI
jgi:hypothetical protein